MSTNDVRFLSGEYVHHSKMLKSITNGDVNKRVTEDKYKLYLDDGWAPGVTISKDIIPVSKNSIWIYKDTIRKRIYSEQIENYLIDGWKQGIPKRKCTNCGKIGSGSSMSLYHFDNCKQIKGKK